MTSPVLTTTGTEQPETATTVKEMGCSHGQRGSSQAWTLPEETRGGMRARLFVDSLKGMWSRSPMNEVSEAVNVAYNALKRLDLSLFHVINGWCGTSVLDYAAWFAQGNNFFKGGIVMAAYWWFWFTPGERDDCRRKIVSALLGMISSLVIARALASSLPFRVRPLYAAGIDYRPHSPPGLHEVSGLNLEDWSSFPSDHAAVFFALAYGLLCLSRPIGILTMLFAAIWVSLVRVYLGIHYPSEVIAGGAIGVTCAYTTGRMGSQKISVPILRFEQKFPQVFYAAMFLITFEISILFEDIRKIMQGSLLVLHALRFESVDLVGALAGAVGVVVLFSLIIFLSAGLLRRRN
jgi:membrane-associated phospholipid phosphatase